MILEINEMIDLLKEFYSSGKRSIVVGGIAGTQIEQYVLDCATECFDFSKILVVNCVQDYIGLIKNSMNNVVYIGDLFVSEMVDPLIPYDPWKPKFRNPEPEIIHKVNVEKIYKYDVIVIFNAGLISSDTDMINAISNCFNGKIVMVCDPIESSYTVNRLINIATMSDIPTVVDTLNKVSPMLALARSTYGFNSRAIDTKVPGSFDIIEKMNKRSIGKIDDKQYVSSDYELRQEIQQKQIESPFRKNQKLIVNDDIVDCMMQDNNRITTLTHLSMLVVNDPSSKPLMKMRLYNSKIIYATDVDYSASDYRFNRFIYKSGNIRVIPANIIDIQALIKHRFNHTVFCCTPNGRLTQSIRYSLCKNSNNVTIVEDVK